MGKISNRDRILSEGMKVVHAQGFSGASVRDIVSAAGVPQGSFTNHFTSKEAFGLEILELYYAGAKARIGATLLDERVAPLQRLRNWVDSIKAATAGADAKVGCMLGNFSAEATNCDGAIRLRLTEIFSEMQGAMANCLALAVADGALPAEFPVQDTGCFIISAMQGAILLSKAHRSVKPIERFEKILFERVLN